MRVPVLLACLTIGGCHCSGTDLSELHALIVASENELHFDDTFVGATRPLTLQLTDAGSAAVIIDSVVVDDAVFSLASAAPKQLSPGQTVALTVVFTPKDDSAVTAHLVVTSSAENNHHLAIELTGAGKPPLDCDDHNACTDEHFDAVSGACIRSDHVGACDDASACTTNDRCFQGACVGDAIVCADTQACTRDTCDPTSGCLFVPDDTLCADTDPCSLDRCDQNLGCTHNAAPDGTPCGSFTACVSIDLCIAHICTPVAIPDATPCSDSDVCTIDDHCQGGLCTGTATTAPPTVIAETHRLVAPATSAFIGDTLYMSDDTVKVVPLVAGQPAFPTSSIPEIPGRSQLFASGSHLVGVGPNNGGVDAHVRVIDPSTSPATVLADVDAGRLVATDRPASISADGNTLYACRNDAAGGLFVASLTAPFSTTTLATSLCPPSTSFVTKAINGTLALDMSADVHTLHVHSLTPTAVVDDATVAITPQFNALWLGSDRAVLIDDSADSAGIAVDLTDPANPRVASFDGACPNRTSVAMIDEELYCADTAVIVRVDFSNIDSPVLDPIWQTLNLGGAGFDHDATRLVVGQGFGAPINVVSLSGAGTATLLVARGGIARLVVDHASVLGLSSMAIIPFPTVTNDVVGSLGVGGVDALLEINNVFGVVTALPSGPTAIQLKSQNDTTEGVTAYGGVNAGVIAAGTDTVPVISGTESLASLVFDDVAHTVDFSFASVLFPPAFQASYFGMTAEGCVGLAMAEADAFGPTHPPGIIPELVVLSICNPAISGGSVVPLAELALNVPEATDADVQNVKIVMHHGTTATVFFSDVVLLVDVTDPTTPRVLAQTAVDFLGAEVLFRDADFDGVGPWLIAETTSDGSATIEEISTGPGSPTLSTWSVPSGTPGTVMRQRVLGVLFPRAYLSAWDPTQPPEAGHGVAIYDLTTMPPTLEETLPLASEPVDLVPFNDTLVVARFDGLSFVSPPCGP